MLIFLAMKGLRWQRVSQLPPEEEWLAKERLL